MADRSRKTEDEGGLFSLAGPRAATIAQIQQQRVLGPAQQAGELFGGPAFFGAALAGALGNKFGKNANALPPELEARVTAQENAERRIQEDREFFNQLDVGQKSRFFRRVLAEEAMRAGLPDIGLQLFKQVSEEHDAAEKRRIDLEKGGIEIDAKRVDLDKKILDLDTSKLAVGKNKFTTIFPRNSNDPNSGQLAFIKEDGTAQLQDGGEVPLGQYSVVRPQRPPQPKSGKTGSVKDLVTPSEMSKLRSQMRDTASQMRAGLRIVDIMRESIGGNKSIDILGSAGTLSAFSTKIVDEVSAVLRTANKAFGGSGSSRITIEGSAGFFGDDKVLDGTIDKALDYADTWDINDSLVPEAIRKDETQVRRYKGAIVNLAYAVSRIEEPGNPKLSDDDFKRGLDQIAASTTNPESLRRTLIDRIGASISDFNLFVDQLPPEILRKAIAPKAFNEFRNLQDTFNQTFGRPFGTAQQPGPGLTDEQDSTDLGDGFTVIFN